MKKDQKKELEQKIVFTIEKFLVTDNPEATEKVRTYIREAGKTISKKFAKAVREQDVTGKSRTKKDKAIKNSVTV